MHRSWAKTSSIDIFLKLPWRFQILEALMEYDLIGFQTVRDLRNFIGCVRMLFGCRVIKSKFMYKILFRDREVLVGAFPISIDYSEFEDLAGTDEVAEMAWIIHVNLPNRQLILGVDRLDYSPSQIICALSEWGDGKDEQQKPV